MPYHQVIATLSGNRQKTLANRTDVQILSEVVIPFVAKGVISANWGKKKQSYQVLELRIYVTEKPWNRKDGALPEFIRGKKNVYSRFEKRAQDLLAIDKPKVFVVIPIQGEKYGTQEEQRIHSEYDKRFETIESVISDAGGVAIRIDKEHPLEDIVGRIKKEIRSATFIISDLTDERPSCYFESGYAEGIGRQVIYIASKDSVIHPG